MEKQHFGVAGTRRSSFIPLTTRAPDQNTAIADAINTTCDLPLQQDTSKTPGNISRIQCIWHSTAFI